MRLTNLGGKFFILLLLVQPWAVKPLSAQCVQADVSLQYNISGSKQPTRRTNDVVMESDRGCRGNASVTTGVQGNIGGAQPIEQHRQVRQRQSGGQGNPSGVNGSTVQIRSNSQVDVYDPSVPFRR